MLMLHTYSLHVINCVILSISAGPLKGQIFVTLQDLKILVLNVSGKGIPGEDLTAGTSHPILPPHSQSPLPPQRFKPLSNKQILFR